MKPLIPNLRTFAFGFLAVSLFGCTSYQPFRNAAPRLEPVDYEVCKKENRGNHTVCDATYYGSYTYRDKYNFDLAFVGFDDFGFAFSANRMLDVLNLVRKKAVSELV